jgi:hypothetical protein
MIVASVLSRRSRWACSGGVSLFERGQCENEMLLLILRMLRAFGDVQTELRKGRFAKRIVRNDSAISQ